MPIVSFVFLALSCFLPTEVSSELHLDDTRVLINVPAELNPAKPTLLILYALPNGNSIEQTIGCAESPGVDWHFNIQHIGAQTRFLRDIDHSRNIVVAYLEADGKSWPAWREKRPDNPSRIRRMVDEIARQAPGRPRNIALLAHSGGGSFVFGYINGADEIDPHIARIALLDANYAYSDEQHHGEKLLSWLRADPARHLVVAAYDDRNIELNGKRVVSDTGGTFRASHRMLEFFARGLQFEHFTSDNIETDLAMNGQIRFDTNLNPGNKILHTRLVEWNGFLHAMSWGSALQAQCGKFCGEPVYTRWIQPSPTTERASPQTPATTAPAGEIPPRPANSPGGAVFARSIEALSPAQREAAILQELSRGNLPDFERQFVTIRIEARGHHVLLQVIPDYLAVGRDPDFVRMPMTPHTAQDIADRFGCSLPTRKIVNEIYLQAKLKLEPRPLTADREAVKTFVEHNQLIELQLGQHALGQLVAGIKKDIVITNRLSEAPHRVAIYGWQKLDGTPIQPLTIVHNDTYVDYSHGVRLIKRDVIVNGKQTSIDAILADPSLCDLLSDEGVIRVPAYR